MKRTKQTKIHFAPKDRRTPCGAKKGGFIPDSAEWDRFPEILRCGTCCRIRANGMKKG